MQPPGQTRGFAVDLFARIKFAQHRGESVLQCALLTHEQARFIKQCTQREAAKVMRAYVV